MSMKKSLYIKLVASAMCAALFALNGCSGGNNTVNTAGNQQFTAKQVSIAGSVNPVVGKALAKEAAATVGSNGSVTVVDAITGATISSVPVDIDSNFQFSGLTFSVGTPKSTFILVAKLTSGASYRAIIPLDLSNEPTGLFINYPLTGVLVGPKSEGIVLSVEKALSAKGEIGIDSGAAFPVGSNFQVVSAAVLANGGGVVAYGSTGISIIGSMEPLASQIQFVYTSDVHYGIKKVAFSGMSSAQQVNGAMITVMNNMQTISLPNDGGVKGGAQMGGVDFVSLTGDTVNRSDGAIYPYKNAPASAMWPQFQADYFTTLNLKDRSGNKAPLFLTTGNHETSNAIGYYKTGSVLDATAYANIYNFMMKPATAMTNDSFIGAAPGSSTTALASYAKAGNRIVTSRDMNGVHFVFIGMWPDSVSRPLIDADLKNVSATTPVILFTHAPPVAESKLFTNPIAPNTINSTNQFENLLSEIFAEATPFATPYSDAAGKIAIADNIEQRTLVAWLKTHKNIVAYFHGHDNANEFYNFTGPDNDISLPTFRVDSPMKGNVSVGDPTKLSFQVVNIDPLAQKMTVREYLWNTKQWGASMTVSLSPRAM